MAERKQRAGIKRKQRVGIIRYLVYLVLVTSVIAAASLAKFVSSVDIGASALIAAFVTDTTLDLQLPVLDMLYPGAEKEVTFSVTNFNASQGSDVPFDYEIQVDTTGNLPLEFSLRGEKEEGEDDSLVGALDPVTLKAVGGRLPSAGLKGQKTHNYRLTIHWKTNDPSQLDPAYSDEIDQVTVKIKTTQAAS